MSSCSSQSLSQQNKEIDQEDDEMSSEGQIPC